MDLLIEVEQEDDGRWIAEAPDLPGVLAYGATKDEAVDAAYKLAMQVVPVPRVLTISQVPTGGRCTINLHGTKPPGVLRAQFGAPLPRDEEEQIKGLDQG